MMVTVHEVGKLLARMQAERHNTREIFAWGSFEYEVGVGVVLRPYGRRDWRRDSGRWATLLTHHGEVKWRCDLRLGSRVFKLELEGPDEFERHMPAVVRAICTRVRIMQRPWIEVANAPGAPGTEGTPCN